MHKCNIYNKNTAGKITKLITSSSECRSHAMRAYARQHRKNISVLYLTHTPFFMADLGNIFSAESLRIFYIITKNLHKCTNFIKICTNK